MMEISKAFVLETIKEYFQYWGTYEINKVNQIIENSTLLDAFVIMVNLAYQTSLKSYGRWVDKMDKEQAKKEVIGLLLFEKGLFQMEYSEKVLHFGKAV